MSGPFLDLLREHRPLQERIANSKHKLLKIQHEAAKHTALDNQRLCVFAAGSLGRLESGEKSDFDVFMISDANDDRDTNTPSVSRLEEYEVFAALIQINTTLGFPRFSGDGRFLKTYELREMIRATGSPKDDSENLFTARMLLLLESQVVTNPDLYERAIKQVIQHYFRDTVGKKEFKPLFFLNDILRYWRTLCLNYEEHRNESGRPWLKKNLNLKFSRKLTIFSTVLFLLSGRLTDHSKIKDLFQLTPIQRLAEALDAIEDEALVPGFKKLLDDYEFFLHAKEEGKVTEKDSLTLRNKYTKAAEDFGAFFVSAIESNRIDGVLRRYVYI